MTLGGLVLGSLILYLKGTRIVMFQLSGFYYILTRIYILSPQVSSPHNRRRLTVTAQNRKLRNPPKNPHHVYSLYRPAKPQDRKPKTRTHGSFRKLGDPNVVP